MIEPTFEWIEDIGHTTCILIDKQGHVFIGTATCHTDDTDMKSRRTGEEISYRRARIEQMRFIRDEINIELKALKQLYYSMKHSSKFNPKSYENIMLQRQIRGKEFDLDTIKEMLATERENLKNFLQEKDKFYNQVRAHRIKAKTLQEK